MTFRKAPIQQRAKRAIAFVACTAAILGVACAAILAVAASAPLDTRTSAPAGNTRSSDSPSLEPSKAIGAIGANCPSREASKRSRSSRSFALRSQQDVSVLTEALPDFPNGVVWQLLVQPITIRQVPDELLRQIAVYGEGLQSLVLGNWQIAPGEAPPVISDRGMEHLSRLRNLEGLSLACQFSGDGFQHLVRLANLQSIGLEYPTITASEFFAMLAQLPDIRSASVGNADFSQPMDDATSRAIVSLNGRLERLSFGEWQETNVHPSLMAAISEIESLVWLDAGNLVRPLPDNFPDCLAKLPYLEHLTPSWGDVVAMRRFDSRETYPIEFRPVTSASGMMALLKCLLDPLEAAKVRREVVRRRAGLSEQSDDFTKSKKMVGVILKESFGVTVYPNTLSTLMFIGVQYPELDAQIRRYLSGMDLEPAAK